MKQRDHIDWQAKAEELAEELRQLKDEVGASPSIDFNRQCADAFGLTPAQAKVLSLLMTGKVKSCHGLWLAYSESSRPRPDIHIIRTIISYLNRSIKPHGIAVSNVHGAGYVLKDGARARISELLQGAGL